MTERKPPGIDVETWVDRQIREAEERGDFAHLTGAGKPLPSLDQPYDELWWIKQKMAREGYSQLPPTLALRKEAEDTLAAVPDAPSERAVREAIADLNAKISANLRRPPAGPPLGLTPYDADEIVARWHESRDER
ncbi:hypothetical protein DSC45_14515 [Streptomyces sp. YIM 130001]|uniref:DnaJ family domain-containing protein n=1 Tax=Streptomyces sp. YIM 130001 TaxID=2259644 RepID=UPI000E656664|nr:DUF1992 domain-containing protein [Streptomyces sp. YIM 130001]RII16973.1 hypothetical protein DSC45_14515 [Streptomyces sp. YIM 130001]